MQPQPSIDATPLHTALAAARKIQDDITIVCSNQAKLESEVSNLLSTINPAEQAAVASLAIKEYQAKLYPRLLAEVEERRDAQIIPALLAVIDDYERALIVADKERCAEFDAAWLPLFELHWPPYDDPAVSPKPIRPSLSKVYGSALRPGLPRDPMNPEKIGINTRRIYNEDNRTERARQAVARAEELLAIGETFAPFDPKTYDETLARVAVAKKAVVEKVTEGAVGAAVATAVPLILAHLLF